MIGHINLLDKVYYLAGMQVHKVTIVSKIYDERLNFGHSTSKVVNIVIDDNVKVVCINELYYTCKEAYEVLLKKLEERISNEEAYLANLNKELTSLYDKRSNVLNMLDTIKL